MFKTYSRNRRKYLLWLAVFSTALVPICLSLIFFNRVSALAKDPNITADPRQRSRVAVLRSSSMTATMVFRPSLEMKENVDFLLTPALLVQEAISDDIIITYPSE